MASSFYATFFVILLAFRLASFVNFHLFLTLFAQVSGLVLFYRPQGYKLSTTFFFIKFIDALLYRSKSFSIW